MSAGVSRVPFSPFAGSSSVVTTHRAQLATVVLRGAGGVALGEFGEALRHGLKLSDEFLAQAVLAVAGVGIVRRSRQQDVTDR